MHALSPSVVDTHTQAPQKRGSPQTEGSVHDRRGTVVVGPGVPTWAKVGVVTLWTIGVAQTRPAPTAPFLMRFRLDSSNALLLHPTRHQSHPNTATPPEDKRVERRPRGRDGSRRLPAGGGLVGRHRGALGDCARLPSETGDVPLIEDPPSHSELWLRSAAPRSVWFFEHAHVSTA